MFVTRRRKQAIVAATLMAMGVGGGGMLAGNKATAARPADVSPHIADYAAENLDDFTATMHVTFHDDNALRKINKDFGLFYKLQGDVKVRYKEENKLRLDARVGASNATMVVNGTTQYVKIALVGKDVRQLGKEPGKRKTLLDVGMISHGYLAYTTAEFKGTRPVDGVPCAVFRIQYRDRNLDSSHRMVWIDPKTKVVLKREEYDQGIFGNGKVVQEGKLVATYAYKEPKEITKGVWFPSRIEVRNNEGQRAGETVYRDVKVNQGLTDDLFPTK